jgi:hypothetical protein
VSFLCSSLTTDRLLESLDASTCLNDLPVLYATPVPTRPAFPGHNLPELILWNTAKLKASFYGLRFRRPISHLGTAPPNEFLVQLRPEWHKVTAIRVRETSRPQIVTHHMQQCPVILCSNVNLFQICFHRSVLNRLYLMCAKGFEPRRRIGGVVIKTLAKLG